MHWSEFIMMIGIIILTTYVSIKVINDFKKFLSKWTILRSNIYNDLIVDSTQKEELVQEVTRLSEELFIERR
jgi:hypothetical protein|tara:strand:- start:614 stop:829 length:216 start_codon:yes stop_codon:yes gene_type:complete